MSFVFTVCVCVFFLSVFVVVVVIAVAVVVVADPAADDGFFFLASFHSIPFFLSLTIVLDSQQHHIPFQTHTANTQRFALSFPFALFCFLFKLTHLKPWLREDALHDDGDGDDGERCILLHTRAHE